MALSRESSFGSWPSDSSKDDVQSVNSGIESEPISLPSEATNGAMTSTHATYNKTHVDQVSEALPSLTGEDKMHPDNAGQVLSNDAILSAEHCLSTSPPNTANILTQHQTPMLSPPEHQDLKEKKSKPTATSSIAAPVQAPGQKLSNVLVYDIATLLELGKGPSITPKEMERCDDDIKENVLKDTHKQDHTRLRGLSNTSTIADESMEAEEQIVFMSQTQRSQRKPIRQPYGPPQSSLAQQHAGFARFLREHASPPHHRVTAGGRIVPNGPLSPPPMFRLDTIDSVVQNPSHIPAAQSPHVSQAEMRSSFDAGPIEQPNPVSAGIANSSLGPSNTSGKEQGYVRTLGRGTITSESSAGSSKGQRQASIGRPIPSNAGAVLQLPPGAVPTMALPEGGLIVNYQGIVYRATLDQANNTLLVPLQVICHAPEVQQPVPSYPPVNTYFTGSLGFQPVTMVPSSSMLAPSMPLANSTNGAHLYQQHQMQTQAHIQSLQNQYDTLHSQLEGLDRHVALYRHLLSPMVNASMVAQRMQLVQQLDSIRVSKEQLERSSSMASQNPGILQPVHMPQGSQAAFEQYGRQNFQIPAGVQSYTQMVGVGNQVMGVAAPVSLQVPRGQLGHALSSSSKTLTKTPTTQTGLKSSTYLSPDAPAFVPNNTSVAAFSSGGKVQGQGDEQMHSSTHQVPHTATSKLARPAQEQVPKVTQDDVEYADRLGFNDEPGPKLYCSTIEDFQEVIRRVREQARMYGCAGGQSKDPEYDAEQDIRWAMSDQDAVPLPTTVPDHVANPRPWKWADSAFNIRADQDAYVANPVRLKHGGNGASTSKCTTTGWGQNNSDNDFPATLLRRQDSWDSLPGTAPYDLAPVGSSNWGKLPSELDAGSAIGWGKIPPTQAKYNGGAPPHVSTANANQLAFNTMMHGNTPKEGRNDGWNTSVRSSGWPNTDKHQDDYIEGWSTPPPSISSPIIRDPTWTWGPIDSSLHQSKVSHPAATENSHQYSETSGVGKWPTGEPTGGHSHAKETMVSSTDVSKPHTSQPLNPAKVQKKSNHKPYQAYVEDVIDSPTKKESYWDVVARGASPRAQKENAWCKDNDKEDDDSSSVDSWGTTRSKYDYTTSQPLPESILEVLRRPGFMNSPLVTNAPPDQTAGVNQGKAFDPSEVKAVRIPSPARNAGTNPFYLNMIKDPRYSVTTGDPTLTSDGVYHGGYGSGKTAQKENQNVQTQPNATVRGEDKTKQGGSSSAASNVGGWPNHQVHKAPSSIAAPVYQAHGYLPPYDGAANSLNWGDSTIGPHRRPASRALLGGGVSVAGPPIGRMDRFPTGHYDGGNHFFRDLRQEEREDLARHKPFNPPNWQG